MDISYNEFQLNPIIKKNPNLYYKNIKSTDINEI